MNWFEVAIMVLQVGAGGSAFWEGHPYKGLYWTAAAVLTFAVIKGLTK